MNLFLLSLAAILLFAAPSSGQQALPVRSVTISDGLPHSDANVLAQDSKGLIWIGTYSGLARYDGYGIRRYYSDADPYTATYDNRIADITIDPYERIWMATDGGLHCFDIVHETYIDLRSQVSAITDPLHTVLYSPGGTLFTISLTGRLDVYGTDADGLQPRDGPHEFDRNVRILSLAELADGTVIVAAESGVWKISPDLEASPLAITDMAGNPVTGINYLTTDSQHRLLCGNNEGLWISAVRLNAGEDNVTTTLIPLRNAASQITRVLYLPDGSYWVSTHDGLAVILSTARQQAHRTTYINTLSGGIDSDYINDILYHRSGILFLACYGHGVTMLNLEAKRFNTIQKDLLPENIVRAMAEDGGKLWTGTNSKGLCCYDLSSGKLLYQQRLPAFKSSNIRGLTLDGDRVLWVASEGGLDALDLKTLTLMNGNTALPSLEISCVSVDRFGNIWAGGWHDGLHLIKKKEDGFEVNAIRLPGKKAGSPYRNHERIYSIGTAESGNSVFFSTERDLYRLRLDSSGEIADISVCSEKPGTTDTPTHFICSIAVEEDNIVWAGTIGGGIRKISLDDNGSYTAQVFSDRDGFPLKDVEAVLLDNQGKVWCAGNGIVRLDPLSREYRLFDNDDGVPVTSFKVGSCHSGSGNKLYFGGIGGMTWFNPSEITLNTITPRPVITALTINNADISPETGAKNSLLKKSITHESHIKLGHKQNNFTLYFSPAHYSNPEKCRFRYLLEGSENRWIYLSAGQHAAHFANLPYGRYRILVQASNNDELWSDNTAALSIAVVPPWWWSAAARFIYVLLIFSVAGIVIWYAYRSVKLNNQLRIKEIEEQKNEQIGEFQSQFFTNISHELRTPLTLILGEVEKFSANDDIGTAKSQGNLKRNAARLLALVNELMDFRKVEAEGMPLQVSRLDVMEFARSLGEEFRSVTQLNKIDYHIGFDEHGMHREGFFDPDILEKILLNILNNAFKYTQKGGRICFEPVPDGTVWHPVYRHTHVIESPYPAGELLWFRVTDTGIGISGESLPRIFDRYYQIHDTEHDPHLGSGVGLALVKSLTVLHRGCLRISSERGTGTEFMIGIPVGKEFYRPEEFQSPDTGKPGPLRKAKTTGDLLTAHSSEQGVSESIPAGSYTILIVEDNTDILDFLTEELGRRYRIIKAANGAEAIKCIETTVPDLIISDWMMPVMDGIALLRRLKCDGKYGHIPFVLLTARDTVESQIEGMYSGANAYISKPFNMELLKSTVNSLIVQNSLMRDYFRENYIRESVTLAEKTAESRFLNRFVETVEQHLPDPDLDVDAICGMMSVSRTKLYRHVQDTCGRSVMDMVRYLRLKKAMQLIAESELSLQEIMLLVGIQSQSYFSRSFKAEFGETPSRFLARYKNGSCKPGQ